MQIDVVIEPFATLRSTISRIVRTPGYRRTAKAQNAWAATRYEALDSAERKEITALLEMFRPVNCGYKMIRVGPQFDGGYILPDDLDGIAALYSPGVSDVVGFDLDFAERGVPCFLADGTVDLPAGLHPMMRFEKVMIGSEISPGFVTLEDWVARNGPEAGDLILQIDIEGGEYSVIPQIPSALLCRFRVIIIEVHSLVDKLLGPERSSLLALLETLTRDHVICHLHNNNYAPQVSIGSHQVPQLLELTLLRQDRMKSNGVDEAALPHPLDMPCVRRFPDELMRPFWRASPPTGSAGDI